MRKKPFMEPRFKFRFGQKVRLLPPHHEAGATGQIMSGQLHPDGREEYHTTICTEDGHFIADDLEDAEIFKPRKREAS